MNGFLYILGALGCVVYRWMIWLQGQPVGTPMQNYFRARFATNVASLVVTLLVMGAWLTGALSGAAKMLVPTTIYSGDFPVAPWTSGIAGFVITYAARALVAWLSKTTGEEDKP